MIRIDQTLIVIKPDAVRKNVIGSILKRFEDEGFKIKELRMFKFSKEQAEEFYSIHKDKPFFNSLVNFITSDKVVAAIIEGNNAIARTRAIIGSTDPSKAEDGTIRKLYGSNIEANAIHASDSHESFIRESKVIFSDNSC